MSLKGTEMNCSKCTAEMPQASQYCPSCGASQVPSANGERMEMFTSAAVSLGRKVLTSKYLQGTRNKVVAAVAALILVLACIQFFNDSKTPEQSCQLNLSNWVITTSNYEQANPDGVPPLMSQFGTSSPITQWVDGQVGSFLSGTIQNGQASVDSQLESAAAEECQSLSSSGTNIGAIPAP